MNAESKKLIAGLALELAAAGKKVPAYDFGDLSVGYFPPLAIYLVRTMHAIYGEARWLRCDLGGCTERFGLN